MTKQILSAAAFLALATSAASVSAFEPGDSYIVSSQIVSDTASPAEAYVGDLDYSSQGGGCENGSCGGGETGSCAGGNCNGNCAGGNCGGGSGVIGRLHQHLHGGAPSVGMQDRKYDKSDLFYNYYTQGNYNSANAQMYISPVPVPHYVGHTFNTYQPFYPQEYLYWHKNRFHNYYDNGRGMNRTRAVYYAPPIKTGLSNIYWNKLRLPR
ncbi:hypothetical protein NHH03_01900 [Stieleria sp. TO1_6]|uniref:hypothetical protein n=1 Tax=Stieleria tagensis TaxID=2956795 RepID=UPI00209B883F|nr:hypothetical protein [Stieleria tagensis]MCO8120474.1 hypothetical protein [Stieleria tagensis]